MSSRYQRQIRLPEVGLIGQQKLQQTKVLCVGAGGLGCPALTYLAAAGIGELGVCDKDRVSLSNLHRQSLYQEQDIGKLKSTIAVERLKKLNSEIKYNNIAEYINYKNIFSIIEQYDYIIDATDNFETKYVLNDGCFYLQKPLVSASVYRFEGQCTLYDYQRGPCMRCLFPETGVANTPACNEAGVIGMIPGLLGTLQALELVKHCLGLPDTLIGKLWQWDVLRGMPQIYEYSRDPECLLCTKKASFDTIWGSTTEEDNMLTDQITVQELASIQENVFILDVRNFDEYQACNMGGYFIPLAELSQRFNEIPQDKPIVVHCRSGHRSQVALEILKQAGFSDVKNLVGGILAWQSFGEG